MNETKVIYLKEDIKLEDTILIVGLPGVGNVGKLVARNLIEELNAEKIIEIYSPFFPPQVAINKDSTVDLVNNELYFCNVNGKNVIILIGDHQSISTKGQYELCGLYLDIAIKYGVSRIYSLGGFPTGELEHEDKVIGAVNDIKLIEELKSKEVIFKENEPGGGIVGAAGLILGLAKFKGIEAACLMGVTSGYIVDPKSAQSLLKIVDNILGIKTGSESLEARAKEMEVIIEKLTEIEQQRQQQPLKLINKNDEDLSYIG
ncbi:MAG: proteasome assembly chaperone family protein [Methanosarcinaceae archaeon]|nr:proteasome assembly chaperone family protein [Methanosarcinaceae archaeon]